MLVTGGCGFVGINLVSSLASRCRLVRVLDDLSVGDQETLKREWPDRQRTTTRLEFVRGDMRERSVVEDTVRGAEAIVHLAAQTGVVSSIEDPNRDHSVNVLGTFNVLEAARHLGVRRVVFASSNAVVGDQASSIGETCIPHPVSPYGASKLAAEGYCSAYHKTYGIETVVLRFANAYGPHSAHKTSVVAWFLSLALSGEPLTIYGEGSQTRDFVYVGDVCKAILLALDEATPSGVYQVGTGVQTRVDELVSKIEEVVGKDLPRKYLPSRRGEVERTCTDNARSLLGSEPRVLLREGLEETYRWFLNYARPPLTREADIGSGPGTTTSH